MEGPDVTKTGSVSPLSLESLHANMTEALFKRGAQPYAKSIGSPSVTQNFYYLADGNSGDFQTNCKFQQILKCYKTRAPIFFNLVIIRRWSTSRPGRFTSRK